MSIDMHRARFELAFSPVVFRGLSKRRLCERSRRTTGLFENFAARPWLALPTKGATAGRPTRRAILECRPPAQEAASVAELLRRSESKMPLAASSPDCSEQWTPHAIEEAAAGGRTFGVLDAHGQKRERLSGHGGWIGAPAEHEPEARVVARPFPDRLRRAMEHVTGMPGWSPRRNG